MRWLRASGLLPMLASGCLLTASLDELEGDPTSCDATRADCDQNPANGCETELDNNPLACGACSVACPSAPSAAPACVHGSCTIACDLFTDNCDGDDANGCETAIEKDLENCGACGHECGDANTTESACVDGTCLLSCASGYDSCDGRDDTGCETELASDTNCGVCGHGCPASACSAGACTPSDKLDNATAIVASDQTLYVAIAESGCTDPAMCPETRKLRSLPVAGGELKDLWDPPAAISDMALAQDGKLYLGSPAGIFVFDPEEAAPPATLHPGNATTIELGDDVIYYLESNQLNRMPLSGGASEVLTENIQIPAGSDAEAVLALGGERLYVMTKTSSEGLHWLPSSGGDPQLVHAGKVLIGLAADASGAWFAFEDQPSSVYRYDQASDSVSELAKNQQTPEWLTSNGSELWWFNRGSGKLMRADLDGSNLTELFQDAPGEVVLAVSGAGVYWLTSAGSLNRLAH